METALEMASHRKGWPFEWLWHVYKPLAQPFSISDVTLAHFYDAQGKSLKHWPLWDRFLSGFNPRLFQMSGISRQAIERDPRLMRKFLQWIEIQRKMRLCSGTSDGECDLLDDPGEVKQRQQARRKAFLRLGQQMAHHPLLRELEVYFQSYLS